MAEWRTLKTEDFALWGDIFIYSVNRLIAWLVFCIQNQLNSSSERFQRKLIYIWQFNVRVVSPSWKVDVTERIEEKQVSLPYKHITKIFFWGLPGCRVHWSENIPGSANSKHHNSRNNCSQKNIPLFNHHHHHRH